MTTKEAIQAMLDGKKVRQTSWNNQSFYLCLGEDGHILDEHHQGCDFHNANDWEIYEEPKPKQTEILYEWLICNELNAWSISDRLRTEEEASTLFKEYDYKSWQKTGRSFEVEL